MKKLLTVEYNPEGKSIEMHLNKKGAEFLLNYLQWLINKNENNHEHLMTQEWGGDELSSEKQNVLPSIQLINHLKVIYWKDDL